MKLWVLHVWTLRASKEGNNIAENIPDIAELSMGPEGQEACGAEKNRQRGHANGAQRAHPPLLWSSGINQRTIRCVDIVIWGKIIFIPYASHG